MSEETRSRVRAATARAYLALHADNIGQDGTSSYNNSMGSRFRYSLKHSQPGTENEDCQSQ